MYKYQNVSGEVQSITKQGDISPRVVQPGEFVTTDVAIENPNFKYIGTADDKGSAVTGTQVAQENVVTNGQLANETNKEIN